MVPAPLLPFQALRAPTQSLGMSWGASWESTVMIEESTHPSPPALCPLPSLTLPLFCPFRR